jgi:hypothetical protein
VVDGRSVEVPRMGEGQIRNKAGYEAMRNGFQQILFHSIRSQFSHT